MLSLSLPATDWVTYITKVLPGSYTMKTVVQLTDLEHNVISDISHLLTAGGVDAEEVEADTDGGGDDGDSSVAVQSTCSLVLTDPDRSVGLDSRSPTDAAVYLDRMVKVVVSVLHQSIGYWVDCPQFCGPVSKFDRDGVTATVEAQSKEWLLLDPADKQGDRSYSGVKTTVIRDIAVAYGEDPARIDMPPVEGNPKVPEAVKFVRATLPWNRIWYLTRTLGETAFFDARGVMRRTSGTGTPVITLRDNMITSTLQVGYDTSNLRNGVRVRGKKSSIDKSEYLPADNPNSRQRLGRRGKLRSRVETVQDYDIRSNAAAERVAKRELKRLGATVVQVAFDCHPVWPLEIGDTVTIDTAEFTGQARVTSFHKPLTADEGMTFGYILPVLAPSTSIRRP